MFTLRERLIFLNKSIKLAERIHKVVDSNLQDASKSQIAREWARKLDREIQYTYAILEAFKKGITKEGSTTS